MKFIIPLGAGAIPFILAFIAFDQGHIARGWLFLIVALIAVAITGYFSARS